MDKSRELTRKPIIAVDFDGTLCEDRYPNIGPPHFPLIELLKKYREGYTLILWTCRQGKQLHDAIWWSGEQGIQFDYVNENTEEVLNAFDGIDTRKIFADLYIDDKSNKPVSLDEIENVLD